MESIPEAFRTGSQLSERKLAKRKKALIKSVSEHHNRASEAKLKAALLAEIEAVFQSRKQDELAMLCQDDPFVFSWLLDRLGYIQTKPESSNISYSKI